MIREERKEYDRVRKAEFRVKMTHRKKKKEEEEEFVKEKRNIERTAL